MIDHTTGLSLFWLGLTSLVVGTWLGVFVFAHREARQARPVDTDLEPAYKPLSMSPAARRIREQTVENQREAAVREFRAQVDAWSGGAA